MQKWFKPAKGTFQIHYRAGVEEGDYEPDFVVETTTRKYLCEPKRADELQSSVVAAKANAAAEWCTHAANHEKERNGKPWSYLLIPDDAVTDNATLAGLAGRHAYHQAESQQG